MRAEAQQEYVEYVEYVIGRLAQLRHLAYLLCGDEHHADDMVQQTVTKLYVRWSRVSRVEHLDQYVRTMLVRTFLDERRRPWSRVGLVADVPDRPVSTDGHVEDYLVMRAPAGPGAPAPAGGAGSALPARHVGRRRRRDAGLLTGNGQEPVRPRPGHVAPATATRRHGNNAEVELSMERDEDDARALLRVLYREPRIPSTVDIGRAMAAGERRQRTVRLAGTGAIAVATGLAVLAGWAVAGAPHRAPAPGASARVSSAAEPSPTSGAQVPTACTIRRLALPPGNPKESIVTGADPSGRFVLGRSYPNDGGGQSPAPVIWDRGEPRLVAMEGGDPVLNDINSGGIAVGLSVLGNDDAAWVYLNGEVARLSGRSAEAYGINDRGVIVGSVGNNPALWASPSSGPTMLAITRAGWSGTAFGIDEDGTVVGELHADRPGGRSVAVVWASDGTPRELPVPTLRGVSATSYEAKAIRNGWVTGSASLPLTGGSAFVVDAARWNLRTGASELNEDLFGGAHAINRNGFMVGSAGSAGLLVTGSKTVQLPELSGATPKPGLHTPTDVIPYTITDDGTTIAGQAGNGDTPVAVTWTCH